MPDQQFANLYWFRKDWFDRPDLKEKFKAKYGYELGVPVNWSAYEDIADFFTNDVKEIDGVRVYGHMDYGKRAPDLGWRMTDAWLSMAGSTSPGLPNGRPIDEWGIRMEEGSCNPAAPRSPAAAAPTLRRRSTPSPSGTSGCANTRLRARPTSTSTSRCRRSARATSPSRSSGTRPSPRTWSRPRARGNNTVDDAGKPLWRMAPSPHGPYWKEGMKLGYQDVGSWTLFNSTPVDRRKAAWLYAQFVVSKTVDVKKSQVGLTFIRDSTIRDKSFTERAPKLGGLVEFYRSPDRVAWTPTGINVPDYPKLAQLWWEQDRRRQLRHVHAAGGDGSSRRADGRRHGPHAGGGRANQDLWRLRSAAQPGEGPLRVARQAETALRRSSTTRSPRARRSPMTS